MVVVGAGESGARASVALREQGYQGSVILIGAERHAPYERRPLSKSALADARPKTIVDQAGLEKIEIEWISAASAVAIDRIERTTIFAGVDITAIEQRGKASLLSLSDGREVEADLIVVGVGASRTSRPRNSRVSRSTTVWRSMRLYEHAISVSLRPGIAALSRARSMEAGA
jgi:NADPH-dependent 2,4-dienoyl-CoA reductase/sulfur reductase-like enzyme